MKNQNHKPILEVMPVVAVLGLGDSETIPILLKHHLIDLKSIGCLIALDGEAPEGDPTLLILGLNPKEHKIPTLLAHFLKKIQKDYPIAYGTVTKHPVYQKLLKQSKFIPTPKDNQPRIII